MCAATPAPRFRTGSEGRIESAFAKAAAACSLSPFRIACHPACASCASVDCAGTLIVDRITNVRTAANALRTAHERATDVPERCLRQLQKWSVGDHETVW